LKDSQKKARAGKWVRRIALGLLGLFGLIAALVAGGLIYLTSPAGGERLLSIALTSARKAIRGDIQAERLEFGGNRLVVHQAYNDYEGYRRELYRTTVKGERPA